MTPAEITPEYLLRLSPQELDALATSVDANLAVITGVVGAGDAMVKVQRLLQCADHAATTDVRPDTRGGVRRVLELTETVWRDVLPVIESLRAKIAFWDSQDATRRAIEGGEA